MFRRKFATTVRDKPGKRYFLHESDHYPNWRLCTNQRLGKQSTDPALIRMLAVGPLRELTTNRNALARSAGVRLTRNQHVHRSRTLFR